MKKVYIPRLYLQNSICDIYRLRTKITLAHLGAEACDFGFCVAELGFPFVLISFLARQLFGRAGLARSCVRWEEGLRSRGAFALFVEEGGLVGFLAVQDG